MLMIYVLLLKCRVIFYNLLLLILIICRGIKTAYIHRTTEDPEEDMQQVRSECDIFVSGTDGSTSCGLNELADILCSPSNNASRLDLED